MRRLPESARLSFRTWTHDDLDLAMTLWGDPKVTALIDARGVLDRAAVEARVAIEIENEKRFGIQYWPMFLKDGGELAGCAGLRPRDVEQRIFEIGFHVRTQFWGIGLASEAGRAVIDFAFNVLDASSLFAGHNPKNDASRRVLLKLGFTHTHDELYPPTGLLHPSYVLERA